MYLQQGLIVCGVQIWLGSSICGTHVWMAPLVPTMLLATPKQDVFGSNPAKFSIITGNDSPHAPQHRQNLGRRQAKETGRGDPVGRCRQGQPVSDSSNLGQVRFNEFDKIWSKAKAIYIRPEPGFFGFSLRPAPRTRSAFPYVERPPCTK